MMSTEIALGAAEGRLLTDDVVETLQQRNVGARWQPGATLRKQLLAQEPDAGRGPLREAIRTPRAASG